MDSQVLALTISQTALSIAFIFHVIWHNNGRGRQ